MLRALRNSWRLLRMALSLARHDALFPLEILGITPALVAWARLFARRRDARRPGERLTAALQEMGPSFIKLGQALSTRADLLSEQVAADLAQLQDHLPAFPGAAARRIIEAELGQPIDALFTSFDDTPVAAASIAQVHFAVTTDGREVAVKVLRPGIELAFERDLDLFYWTAELVERAQPRYRRLKPVDSVRAFADRSEEHTSELQSHSDLVCRLLLEKKKKIGQKQHKPKENSMREGLVIRSPQYRYRVIVTAAGLSPRSLFLLMRRPPPRSTLFPYTAALPI